jgi:hypothetical protein
VTEPAAASADTRFDDLKALFINCTLKRSPEPSHTQGLVDIIRHIMEAHGLQVEVWSVPLITTSLLGSGQTCVSTVGRPTTGPRFSRR